jgi:hypothetical protein
LFAALDALGPSLMPRTSRLQGIAMGERLWLVSLRATGRLLRAGAAGGAVHDLGRAVQRRYPTQRVNAPLCDVGGGQRPMGSRGSRASA